MLDHPLIFTHPHALIYPDGTRERFEVRVRVIPFNVWGHVRDLIPAGSAISRDEDNRVVLVSYLDTVEDDDDDQDDDRDDAEEPEPIPDPVRFSIN